MKRLSLPTVLLVALLLGAHVGATSYPLTVADGLGRDVLLDRAPQRIVTMFPSHTETLCALSACDLLVGVDGFSDYPEEVRALPSLGSGFQPDVERIVALEPDLVIVDAASGLADTLADLGLTVYASSPGSYEEAFAAFAALGLLVDREGEAAALAERVRREVDAVAEQTAGLPAPTVYYELDPTPYSVGPGSFIDDLIARAGGANIVTAAMGAYPQLDPEIIVEADPEVIVLADAPYGESAAAVAARPGWSEVRALVSGRVAELSDDEVDILNRPGPRLGEAVRLLAAIFHPDRF